MDEEMSGQGNKEMWRDGWKDRGKEGRMEEWIEG